jgi:uncharacterized protein (DUF983 family)
MEFTCPHCGQYGISAMEKFRAIPKSPAICRKCGKTSALEQGAKIKLLLVATGLLMLVGPALYAFAYPSLLFMLLMFIPLLLLPVATYYLVPLAPITRAETERASKIYKAAVFFGLLYLVYKAYDISNSL